MSSAPGDLRNTNFDAPSHAVQLPESERKCGAGGANGAACVQGFTSSLYQMSTGRVLQGRRLFDCSTDHLSRSDASFVTCYMALAIWASLSALGQPQTSRDFQDRLVFPTQADIRLTSEKCHLQTSTGLAPGLACQLQLRFTW